MKSKKDQRLYLDFALRIAFVKEALQDGERSPWLNLVKWFFADLTQDRIRSGSFPSLKELKKSAAVPPEHSAVRPRAKPTVVESISAWFYHDIPRM